ncbi:hypothetical protein JAAARDRAFT_137924, partial [Jaapia argillacea MUCL 33604]
WNRYGSVHKHLHPLAVAANATQANHARLDVVLLTLANLYQLFSLPNMDPNVSKQVLESLEKRWSNTDQEIFILAVVLNPYLRNQCFHPNSPFRTEAQLWMVTKRAFVRFFSQEPDLEFSLGFADYIHNCGDFSDEAMLLREMKEMAMKQGVDVNLVAVWRRHDWGLENGVNGTNGLVNLAMRIVSIVPNSAGIERIFSDMGILQNKIHNRLGVEKVHKIVLVKQDTITKFGSVRRGKKRKSQEESAECESDNRDDTAVTSTSRDSTNTDSTTTTTLPADAT